MKTPVMAAAGLVIGLAGGALFSGLGVKAEILEARAQAEADSLSALAHGERVEEQESITVELPDPPPIIEETPVVEETPAHQEGTAVAPPIEEEIDTVEAPQDTMETVGLPEVEGSSTEQVTAEAGPEERASSLTVVLNDEGSRKLAKIFAAMDPQDAAAVLAEMTDEEVTAVLLRMSDRKAAPVIASFPPERAATLSQAVLRSGAGGPQ